MIGANISKFISDVVSLIENKTTSDIIDVSNESSKEGIRIVLELRRNADAERLENLLYKKTRLEDTFGVNMLAIANGKPELLSLKDIISHHTKFHYEVLTRKYETLLKKELEQKEILFYHTQDKADVEKTETNVTGNHKAVSKLEEEQAETVCLEQQETEISKGADLQQEQEEGTVYMFHKNAAPEKENDRESAALQKEHSVDSNIA